MYSRTHRAAEEKKSEVDEWEFVLEYLAQRMEGALGNLVTLKAEFKVRVNII